MGIFSIFLIILMFGFLCLVFSNWVKEKKYYQSKIGVYRIITTVFFIIPIVFITGVLVNSGLIYLLIGIHYYIFFIVVPYLIYSIYFFIKTRKVTLSENMELTKVNTKSRLIISFLIVVTIISLVWISKDKILPTQKTLEYYAKDGVLKLTAEYPSSLKEDKILGTIIIRNTSGCADTSNLLEFKVAGPSYIYYATNPKDYPGGKYEGKVKLGNSDFYVFQGNKEKIYVYFTPEEMFEVRYYYGWCGGIKTDKKIVDDILQSIEIRNKTKTEVITNEQKVLITAREVIQKLSVRDYETLEELVGPDGLSLDIYPNFDLQKNLIEKKDISQIPQDTKVYLWGYTDGKGDPINLTRAEFLTKWIYNNSIDYLKAPYVAINKKLGGGNSVNTIDVAREGRTYVAFHFSGFDPKYSGMDWTTLYLIFDFIDSEYKLRGIAKDNWTI